MNRIEVCGLLVVAGLTFAGCASTKSTVEENNANAEAKPAPSDAKTTDAAAIPAAVAKVVQNFKRVHFEFDSSALSDETRSALMENVTILKENPEIKVEIQGHCDDRGTTDYNLALGDQRAKAVQDYMVRAGIASAKLAIVSYGKEKPLESGDGEHAWSKNRRAEFRVTWNGNAGVDVMGTTN